MTDLLLRFAARSDLHQSSMHANLMRAIGWHVEGKPGSQIFYRTLGPVSVAKLQRPKTINLAWLKSFRRTHHTFTTYVEPGLTCETTGIKGLSVEPFAHSCTSLIDLTPSEKSILSSFSQKTRYNITHTLKKNDFSIITTPLSTMSHKFLSDFFALHHDWSKQKHIIGYSLPLLRGILKSFVKHADLHLCYLGDTLIGSLLILYHDAIATYWAAFASPLGYQHFAPTLLTWTAISTAKERDCDIFDFGGIYDPRYPRMYKKWLGFTKFKAGFNPIVVSYPETHLQLLW